MKSKPINLINAKLEEMYDGTMFWFYSTIQAHLMQTFFIIEFLS